MQRNLKAAFSPRISHLSAAGIATLALVGAAFAQGVPDYDFDWATIGDLGNPAYDREDPFFRVLGRGSVDYSYRISKVENTTAQWMEFVNTFSTQSDDFDIRFFGEPAHWGEVQDPDYNGLGIRWKLNPSIPFAATVPAACGCGIRWPCSPRPRPPGACSISLVAHRSGARRSSSRICPKNAHCMDLGLPAMNITNSRI